MIDYYAEVSLDHRILGRDASVIDLFGIDEIIVKTREDK